LSAPLHVGVAAVSGVGVQVTEENTVQTFNSKTSISNSDLWPCQRCAWNSKVRS
jgi:hypothetical protein